MVTRHDPSLPIRLLTFVLIAGLLATGSSILFANGSAEARMTSSAVAQEEGGTTVTFQCDQATIETDDPGRATVYFPDGERQRFLFLPGKHTVRGTGDNTGEPITAITIDHGFSEQTYENGEYPGCEQTGTATSASPTSTTTAPPTATRTTIPTTSTVPPTTQTTTATTSTVLLTTQTTTPETSTVPPTTTTTRTTQVTATATERESSTAPAPPKTNTKTTLNAGVTVSPRQGNGGVRVLGWSIGDILGFLVLGLCGAAIAGPALYSRVSSLRKK